MQPRRHGPHERALLVAFLATLLFAGALRAFIASVYFHNLTTLGVNATAAWALLLVVAPLAYLAPAARERWRGALLVAASVLALARLAMPLATGGAAFLPLAGVAAAAYLALLPALLRAAPPALVGAGVALAYALDVALVAWGRSADPTVAARGLLLVAPVALLLLLAAATLRPVPAGAPAPTPEPASAPARPSRRARALAATGLGAFLFLQNGVLAPFAVARWNEVDAGGVVAATLAGFGAAAWLLAGGAPRPRWLLPALHVLALAAFLDHAYVHSRFLPLLLAPAQAALALDAAILLARLRGSGLAFALSGLVIVLLHFLAVFTWVFSYVPLSGLWKGQEDVLALATLALVAIPALLPEGARAPRPAPAGPSAARRSLALLLVAPLLVSAVALADAPAPPQTPPPEAPLTVMAFNVHQGFGNDGALRPDLFAEILRRHDPDVVFLQESDAARPSSGNLDLPGLLAHELGYHVAYGQPSRAQAFGGALLSRHPIEAWTALALPSGSDNRWVLEARLDVRGTDVWAYAVHMGLPREDRLAQTTEILARAATREAPVILAGDFNSCPEGVCPEEGDADAQPDDVYARLTARYQDAWVAAGHGATDPAGHTYDAAAPFERIDYVLVSDHFEVLEAERVRDDLAVAASDHLPVLARLRLR